MDFVCGGAAALSAITIMHPVDVVKTRLQFQGEQMSLHHGNRYHGVISSLIQIGKAEGIHGLYRGITAAYMLQVSVTATRFGVYGFGKTILSEHFDIQGSGLNFILAGVSGFCGAVLGTPWYALKTRAQTFSSNAAFAVGTQHDQSKSLIGQFRNIYFEEGLGGYFRGIEAFAPRVIAYGSFQLATYDAIKPILAEEVGIQDGFPLQASTAFVASCTSVCAMQPFDFVATRLMNQPVDKLTGKGLFYSGPIDCIVKSIQSEGITSLSKGGWANISRMGPYTVLVLVFFEQFKAMAAST